MHFTLTPSSQKCRVEPYKNKPIHYPEHLYKQRNVQDSDLALFLRIENFLRLNNILEEKIQRPLCQFHLKYEQDMVRYQTILGTHWGQKTYLAILRQHTSLSGTRQFLAHIGDKKLPLLYHCFSVSGLKKKLTKGSIYNFVAVTSSGILKAKQKLQV